MPIARITPVTACTAAAISATLQRPYSQPESKYQYSPNDATTAFGTLSETAIDRAIFRWKTNIKSCVLCRIVLISMTLSDPEP